MLLNKYSTSQFGELITLNSSILESSTTVEFIVNVISWYESAQNLTFNITKSSLIVPTVTSNYLTSFSRNSLLDIYGSSTAINILSNIKIQQSCLNSTQNV